MNNDLDRLAREIGASIEEELLRCGVFFRLFVRAKSLDSIEKKIKEKKYDQRDDGKLMQDIIGLRVTTYFDDDLMILYDFLKSKSNFVDETKDEKQVSVFEPERINLIFKLNEKQCVEVVDLAVNKFKFIDTTYELQLRTVLSEGWHEVEHDLRYKCKSDWDDHKDISHIFNGIYASLVASDWSILNVFEKLAYRHYKARSWSAMLRNKFRLRFLAVQLSDDIIGVLNDNAELSKEIFRVDRVDLIKRMMIDRIKVPLTLNNLIFLINGYYLRNEKLTLLTPEFILNNKKIFVD